MTATVLALHVESQRLVSSMHKLCGGTRLSARLLASNVLRYSTQRDRFAYLVAQGYRPEAVQQAMRAAGLIAGEDTSSPCGNPACKRRITRKQHVVAVRVGDGLAVFCGGDCCREWMREERHG